MRDLIWATLDPDDGTTASPREIPDGLPDTALQALHTDLNKELADAVERKKIVEGKLSSVVSMTPIPVTIVLAVVAFLSSGRFQDFTGRSIVVIVLIAFLIALQFLRALLAAVHGLSRMGYWQPRAVVPAGAQPSGPSNRELCVSLLTQIESYDRNTNEKVSQLALAHRSLKNSVLWLLIAIAVLGVVTIWEAFNPAQRENPAGTPTGGVIGQTPSTSALTDRCEHMQEHTDAANA